jgi:hypothetical protein
MQTHVIDGYEVSCTNEEEGKQKIKKHKGAGLKGEFLKKSLDSLYPIEYWLDQQN